MPTPESSLPPGPPLPAWLQSAAFAFARERFVAACRRRYGGIVRFDRVAGEPFVMVLDPEPAKEILHAPPDRLQAAERERAGEPGVEGEKHGRRAERAEYLREKLEERARAEEEAAAADAERGEGGDAPTAAPSDGA